MRNKKNHLNASARRLRIGLAVAASALSVCVLPATALGATATDTTQFAVSAGTLSFTASPNLPDFSALTLSGQAQTLNAQMASYTVADATGSAAGWNVTVAGDGPAGSAVFKQYCSNGASACGSDAANSYVSGGATLAANSLTLSSTGAGMSAVNSSGAGPTHSCGSGCFVDAASPVKVATAATGSAGMGTYQLNGYSASSLGLSAPSTVKALPANEIYRVNLLWSLNSGP
jgi:hypothetical protein